jgi:hypothetical protein
MRKSQGDPEDTCVVSGCIRPIRECREQVQNAQAAGGYSEVACNISKLVERRGNVVRVSATYWEHDVM